MRRVTSLMVASGLTLASLTWAGGDKHEGGYRGEFGGNYGAKAVDRAEWVENLRKQGPEGLKKVLAAYDQLRMSAKRPEPEEVERCRAEVDRIAGQRHATVSRLFWYTDLNQAKVAAAEAGKPILSLRMLGKLTDEYSCANSRFFRTSLYANKEISARMRDHFVLHWQSVRPVPTVSIDFGDGRKLQRTITGNSAHYALNAEGRPFDVLPGLYSPQEFLSWLNRVKLFADANQKPADRFSFESRVSAYHQARHQFVLAKWQEDLRQAGLESTVVPHSSQRDADESGGKFAQRAKFPNAQEAGKIAFAKRRAEGPLITVLGLSPATVESRLDDTAWQKIAALHRDETRLDEQSVALMRHENPNALAAGAVATTKRAVEDPILRAVRSFENSIALDTVRNEYLLHRKIHQWFLDGSAFTDIDTLNERVYAELFLTPSSDPWLGLVPPNTYTALQDDGLTVTSQ